MCQIFALENKHHLNFVFSVSTLSFRSDFSNKKPLKNSYFMSSSEIYYVQNEVQLQQRHFYSNKNMLEKDCYIVHIFLK